MLKSEWEAYFQANSLQYLSSAVIFVPPPPLNSEGDFVMGEVHYSFADQKLCHMIE